MPIFEIQTPNGKILTIEAADEATALKGAQEWYSQNGTQTPAEASQGLTDGQTSKYGYQGPVTLPAPSGKPPEPEAQPSRFERFKDFFTGELSTQYPDAPEFREAHDKTLSPGAVRAMQALSVSPNGIDESQYAPEDVAAAKQFLQGQKAISQSAVSPDVLAQIDILRSQIPNLEVSQDDRGNVLVRAPGMDKWSYLNKPGLSKRDIEEFSTQSAIMAPFLGPVGKVAGAGGKALAGAAGMGTASVTQDVIAGQEGSEQGISPLRAGINAAVGAVTPAIAPVIEGGKNLVAKSLRSLFGAPPGSKSTEVARQEALKQIEDALGVDQRVAAASGGRLLTDRAQGAAQAQGQPVVNLEMGGTALRRLARDAANKSPEAQGILESVVDKRFTEQAPRLVDRLRAAVSTKANAYESELGLKQAARTARKPLYDKAYAEGAQGHLSEDLLKILDTPEGKKALATTEKTMANRAALGPTTGAEGPDGYTLEFWDVFKQSLDDAVGAYSKAGEKSLANTARSMKDKVLDELDSVFPSYSKARGVASEFFKAGDALEAGQKFAETSGSYDLAKAKNAISKLTDPEKVLFEEGFISEIVGKADSVAYRRDLTKTLMASPEQKAKFEAVLGKLQTKELEAYLHVENLMELSHRAVVGNSTSARQISDLGTVASDAFTQGIGTGVVTGNPAAGILAGIVAQGRKLLGEHFSEKSAQNVATEIAKLLASKDQQVINDGISRLAQSGQLDTLRQFDKIADKLGLWKYAATKQGADYLGTDNSKPAIAKALRNLK